MGMFLRQYCGHGYNSRGEKGGALPGDEEKGGVSMVNVDEDGRKDAQAGNEERKGVGTRRGRGQLDAASTQRSISERRVRSHSPLHPLAANLQAAASPTRAPAVFDTALVGEDIKEYQALGCIAGTPEPRTGMYIVKRSTCHSRRNAAIVPIDRLVRGCHLLGKCGAKIDWSWTTDNVLDLVTQFYFNPYRDCVTAATEPIIDVTAPLLVRSPDLPLAFFRYLDHLKHLSVVHEWTPVHRYHVEFFNNRVAEMRHGDFSNWAIPEAGLVKKYGFDCELFLPEPHQYATNKIFYNGKLWRLENDPNRGQISFILRRTRDPFADELQKFLTYEGGDLPFLTVVEWSDRQDAKIVRQIAKHVAEKAQRRAQRIAHFKSLLPRAVAFFLPRGVGQLARPQVNNNLSVESQNRFQPLSPLLKA
ncbi:uncharacterized protein LACBIDRAFT_328948 [Laccaria bicolor S238N-H82]|uniref:Predicted protein n=1 Tax=Laccaria bicolor (strain S238N-H82 / ATCC MYA-4686) TaxID=486041 RepID=B0DGJ0_LACBS|nr:uncharacterized protein LACBIDRAFT_328948 [Laccaria bicolor S238N-H82]EDR06161.1 predicted protein [Laccaria bicolor S238N-H82]|eukprot:XP_001883022.1 predicted protein [Laccaria bicolor S238N-H82]